MNIDRSVAEEADAIVRGTDLHGRPLELRAVELRMHQLRCASTELLQALGGGYPRLDSRNRAIKYCEDSKKLAENSVLLMEYYRWYSRNAPTCRYV